LPVVVASKVKALKGGLPPLFTTSTKLPVESTIMPEGVTPVETGLLCNVSEGVVAFNRNAVIFPPEEFTQFAT
jgi:hypothetical protein